MDWQQDKRPPSLSPPRLARDHASFSAALLDAIYRSIDTSAEKTPDSKNSSPDMARVPPAEFWRDPRAAPTDHRNPSAPQKYPVTPRYQIPSTTSTPRRRSSRPNRVQPDPSPNSPPNDQTEFESHGKNDEKKGKKKKKKRSIIGLLKSLFSLKRDKKGKRRPAEPPASTETGEPIGSSARSCMSGRIKSEGMKRSVRFAPASVIVDEKCKPCGRKRVYEAAVERQVEELMKALKTEDKGKRKNGSGSSGSDLSELDSLVVVTGQNQD